MVAVAPEIEYIEGFKYQKLTFLTVKTRLNYVLRVYKSIFEKSIFSPNPMIENLEFIRYQELNNKQENAGLLRVYTSIVQKC